MINIIWDFDGTLFDTYPQMAESLRMAIQSQKKDVEISLIHRLLKTTFQESISYFALNLELNEETLLNDYQKYNSEKNIALYKPFPFVYEACKFIVSLGGQNFLVTHRGYSAIEIMNFHGFTKLFSGYVTKEMNFRRKPDPESFLHILNHYHLDPHKTLGIGDRSLDVLAAQNSGIKSCLFSTQKEISDCKPNYKITSMDELINIIQENFLAPSLKKNTL